MEFLGWSWKIIIPNGKLILAVGVLTKKFLWKFNGKVENVTEKLVEFEVLKRVLTP